MTLLVMGRFSFSGGGYSRVTIRLHNDRITSIRHGGETSSTAAPDAYCPGGQLIP
ncbi:MAG: hypothetical protein JSR91_20700 [Proteobacteria bacterium]|nr:hypothetical protein [Pseudomonadota bacterium]